MFHRYAFTMTNFLYSHGKRGRFARRSEGFGYKILLSILHYISFFLSASTKGVVFGECSLPRRRVDASTAARQYHWTLIVHNLCIIFSVFKLFQGSCAGESYYH